MISISGLTLASIIVVFAILMSSSAQSNSYNFAVTPGTYSASGCGGIGCWTVPANTILTVSGYTNDGGITNITMSGTAAPSGNSFYFQGAPDVCTPGFCLNGTVPADHDVAGDTWTVTVTFYKGSSPMQTITARIYPTIIVAPEFPVGTLLAVVAPAGALIAIYFYARRRSNANLLNAKKNPTGV
jgi:hypothetical protein